MSTDADWNEWGRTDPYYGVITDPRYRSAQLTDEALGEFFRSGDNEIRQVLRTIRTHIDQGFTPVRVLDFGCGPGRRLIALAGVADTVVGVDVSDGMLAEAKKNCKKFDITNVLLKKSDDELTQLVGKFDLIHSVIVFQHIPTNRGIRLFKKLLEHLDQGGVGAIQVTYAKANDDRVLLCSLTRRARRIARRIRRKLVRPVQGQDPEMQMNYYPMNELLLDMQRAGVRNFYSEFTDHGGYCGVSLYFQKLDTAVPR